MRRVSSGTKGFALVVVLTLLAMLVLVTYAISLIGRVDTQVGIAASYQVQARQRAMLGLRMALAELQVAAGPNNRITAMAGVVGVGAADNRRQIAGVWGSGINPVWLVSGNIGGAVPFLAGERVELVGPGSVGAPNDRTDQERVEAGLIDLQSAGLDGHYAFWVGDEGVKISAGVPDALAQIATETGRPLRLDAGWVLGSRYNPTAENIQKILAVESLRFPRSSGGELSLTSASHAITVLHRSLPSSATGGIPQVTGFVEGGFNINTTSVLAWRGLLSYPDRSNSAHGFNSNITLNNARRISSSIEARGSPFSSPLELISSGLLQAAFDATPNRITSITAQEFFDDVASILTVRSDTFKIRAYGDAINPADANDPNAKPEAVAYCEAIVQRTDQDLPGYGKKFVITYFRWLGPDDI